VNFHDPISKIEADACPWRYLLLRSASAITAFEKLFGLVWTDGYALASDTNREAVLSASRDQDFRSAIGVFDCILQEIGDRLRNEVFHHQNSFRAIYLFKRRIIHRNPLLFFMSLWLEIAA